MNCVISYDIQSDKVRAKVARILEDYGDRVQKSVFHLFGVAEIEIERCIQRLSKVSLLEGDSIKIYSLCKTCLSSIEAMGTPSLDDNKDVYVI